MLNKIKQSYMYDGKLDYWKILIDVLASSVGLIGIIYYYMQ